MDCFSVEKLEMESRRGGINVIKYILIKNIEHLFFFIKRETPLSKLKKHHYFLIDNCTITDLALSQLFFENLKMRLRRSGVVGIDRWLFLLWTRSRSGKLGRWWGGARVGTTQKDRKSVV